jgi:hypothetical protein
MHEPAGTGFDGDREGGGMDTQFLQQPALSILAVGTGAHCHSLA